MQVKTKPTKVAVATKPKPPKPQSPHPLWLSQFKS